MPEMLLSSQMQAEGIVMTESSLQLSNFVHRALVKLTNQTIYSVLLLTVFTTK